MIEDRLELWRGSFGNFGVVMKGSCQFQEVRSGEKWAVRAGERIRGGTHMYGDVSASCADAHAREV